MLTACFWLLCAALCAGQTWAQDAVPAEVAVPVDGPSEEAIRDAYAANLADLNERSVNVMGAEDAARFSLTLDGLTKLGCRGMSTAGVNFDCRVERRLSRGNQRPETDVVQLWLSYENDAWIVR